MQTTFGEINERVKIMKKLAIYRVYSDNECIFEGTLDAKDRKGFTSTYPNVVFVKTGSFKLTRKF